MKECGDVVIVAEDLKSNTIAACMTVVREWRFNRRIEYSMRLLDLLIDMHYWSEDLASL